MSDFSSCRDMIAPLAALENPVVLPDEAWADLLEAFQEEGFRMHAVFAPGPAKALLEKFFASSDTPEYLPLFADTPYAPFMAKSPWWFELTTEHEFWLPLSRSIERWGVLAFSRWAQEDCVTHWKSLLNALLPDRTLTHFRFYSGDVLVKIAGACTQRELELLLGPHDVIAVPRPRVQTPWAVIVNPCFLRDATEPEDRLRAAPWWRVSEKQLEVFGELLDDVYKKNLELWLWEDHADHARVLHRQSGGLRRVVAETVDSLRNFGFSSQDHITRAVTALLPFLTDNASGQKVREILARAGKDPLAALEQLETLARRRQA